MKSSSMPRTTCISLLYISSNTDQVKQIHAQMITNSLSRASSNLAKLVTAYFAADSGSEHAKLVFKHADADADADADANSNTRLRNVMIKFGSPEESIHLFSKTIEPDKFTYTHVLRACAATASLPEGKQAHARAVKSGLASDVAVQTTAIHFYASCRDLLSASRLFDEMTDRNPVTWNSMLTGYSTNGAVKETLSLFRNMLENGVGLTERTAVPLLSACSQLGDFKLSTSIHGLIYKAIPFDCFIGTGLITTYSKCGSLEYSWNIFNEMRSRNVLTWTAMAAGLAMHGKGKEALDLMDEMVREGVPPNAVTFTCLLSACCHAGLLEEGASVFKMMRERFGIEPGVRHYGCLVDLFGRAGLVEEAREVVRGMPMEPDTVMWRAVLSACKVHGRVEIGEEVGKRLVELEESKVGEDRSCEDFVALSNVYASVARWEDVWRVREVMREVRVKNKVSFSSVQHSG